MDNALLDSLQGDFNITLHPHHFPVLAYLTTTAFRSADWQVLTALGMHGDAPPPVAVDIAGIGPLLAKHFDAVVSFIDTDRGQIYLGRPEDEACMASRARLPSGAQACIIPGATDHLWCNLIPETHAVTLQGLLMGLSIHCMRRQADRGWNASLQPPHIQCGTWLDAMAYSGLALGGGASTKDLEQIICTGIALARALGLDPRGFCATLLLPHRPLLRALLDRFILRYLPWAKSGAYDTPVLSAGDHAGNLRAVSREAALVRQVLRLDSTPIAA